MNLQALRLRLARNAEAIESLVRNLSDEEVRWTPAPGKWSVLLVVNHLADEERDDFRARVDHALHTPDAPLPPIDPGGWVTERRYAEQEPGPSLQRFLDERHTSLAWLADLRSPDWSASHEQMRSGRMTAGDFMASWVDHDYLHMRQLLGLHHALLCRVAEPYTPDYAGGSW